MELEFSIALPIPASPTEQAAATPSDVKPHGLSDAGRRLLGAYYTPGTAADFMAEWVVRQDGEHVLEPSFGDGVFLRAVARSTARRDFRAVRLSGVEIDESAGAQSLHDADVGAVSVFREDFLGVRPFKVQAVIGNPPYVRLRHLSGVQRERALDAAWMAMRQVMDPSGSLWMPFVLHAMRFLDMGGRMAFVLPYDLTYVRYARPLWETLRNNFRSLRVLRTHKRLFPELLQDVVILLADDYGSRTETVRYQAFERVEDLLRERPVVDEALGIEGLLNGERPFIGALLGGELRCLLNTRIAELTVPAREVVTFNIGYVTGDKTLFHPTSQDICEYQLPSRSLRPSLTSAPHSETRRPQNLPLGRAATEPAVPAGPGGFDGRGTALR